MTGNSIRYQPLCAALCAALLVATTLPPLSATEVASAKVAPAEITPGRQRELIYLLRHDCGSCHGMTLKGGLGPALTAEALAAKPEQLLINTIALGRPGSAMPPWQNLLRPEEIRWLVQQLVKGKIDE